MDHIEMLPWKFDTLAAREELSLVDDEWNRYTERTSGESSPHRLADDIWLRYNDRANFTGNLEIFNGPHESVWYPVAKRLQECARLSQWLANHLKATMIGGILITRVKPFSQIFPHADTGWHAQYYEKFAIQIQGHLDQSFSYNDGDFISLSGDSYWFQNHVTHWVMNQSSKPRITLIVCLKRGN